MNTLEVSAKMTVRPGKLEGFKRQAVEMDNTFNPQTLADDLTAVCDIYARFFDTLNGAKWDKPVKGSPQEWNLHETIAHLCALNGAGLESIQHTLAGEPYTFVGLDNRYVFNAYNRRGIDDHRGLPMKALCDEFLAIHRVAADLARTLQPGQAECTAPLPIYNRPVQIVETLSIMVIHAGLFHTAQVAEPAGLPPLWMQLSPEIRHRIVGRTMRAFSLLYRHDIGDPLRTTIVFRIAGPGGGEWYVKLAPDDPTSGEGSVDQPGLVIRLRKTDVFCQMLTGRFHPIIGLLTGQMRLRGDLRLFLRMGKLFSVDAKP